MKTINNQQITLNYKEARKVMQLIVKSKLLNVPKGFTLIELLIVVAIIGVLAALLMTNFIGIRQRARDGQRKSDLRQIQIALETYRTDQGQYPAAVSSAVANCPVSAPLSLMTVDCTSQTYMSKVPTDPLGSGQGYNSGRYFYLPAGSNTTYTLAACLENTNDSEKAQNAPGGSGCASNTYFSVTNP